MSTRATLLLVEDKENLRKLLQEILSEHYGVTSVATGNAALACLSTQQFDLVLTDVRLPGADGFEILEAVQRQAVGTETVLMTAYATVQRAVDAIKLGAYDYLQKPFEPDDVVRLLARALERKRLRELARDLQGQLSNVHQFEGLLGKSPAMQEVFELLERAADVELAVLIAGESGTGKELAARAIHDQSGRKDGPFVAINCGAIPTELVESELFGHTKGAFTGAVSPRAGAFVEAQDGTLFLDEIGELPLAAQVKLNRALQEGEVRPVGGASARHTNARIIAASLRDLREDLKVGRFREDLFYRLNVFPIRLPPLRERAEDIPLLAAHLLRKHGLAQGKSVEHFDPEALALISDYPYPGNVRELENASERAVALTKGGTIEVAALPAELRETPGSAMPAAKLSRMTHAEAVQLARDRGSRDYLSALLTEFHGNVTNAAPRAGVERESLHRLLKRYGLHTDDFRRGDDGDDD